MGSMGVNTPGWLLSIAGPYVGIPRPDQPPVDGGGAFPAGGLAPPPPVPPVPPVPPPVPPDVEPPFCPRRGTAHNSIASAQYTTGFNLGILRRSILRTITEILVLFYVESNYFFAAAGQAVVRLWRREFEAIPVFPCLQTVLSTSRFPGINPVNWGQEVQIFFRLKSQQPAHRTRGTMPENSAITEFKEGIKL